MNKRWFVPIIALILVALCSGAALGLEPFAVREYVTDRAGMLSETQRQGLASELWKYDQATGNQILVVTVPSLEDREAVEFTEALFELNQPGQKGKDNGLILFVAQAERKIRIEVGYGLESVVPDGRAGTIIRDEISPRFRAGDFSGGITAGTVAIIRSITPDYRFSETAPPAPRPKRDRSFPAAFVVAMIIFGVVTVFGQRDRGQTHRRYRRGYSEPTYWGGGWPGGGGWSGSNRDRSGGGFRGGGGGFGGGGASGGW